MEQLHRGLASAVGYRLRTGLWGLGLLLCLAGCGNAPSDAPQAATPESDLHTRKTPNRKVSPHSGLSSPSRSSIPIRTPSSKQPIAGGPAHADPHEQARTSVAVADQAAWTRWYEVARESPDVSVRLQALETWVQRPGHSLDPLTYGLVDQDETVRERAQALYEQTLARDAAAAVPVQQKEDQEALSNP